MNIKLFFITLMLIGASSLSSSAQDRKTETIVIQTSAKCGMCKTRIEHDLKFEKGVQSAELDNATKKLTVVYRADKTNPEKIRVAVTKIGYDADEVPADQKAHDRLPACCQKTAKPH